LIAVIVIVIVGLAIGILYIPLFPLIVICEFLFKGTINSCMFLLTLCDKLEDKINELSEKLNLKI
jgi:hypothetical protein